MPPDTLIAPQPPFDLHGYTAVDAAALPWRPSTFAPGVEVKDLGSANGQSMQLVRFAPGAVFPRHTHAGPEFLWLIEGEALQQGRRLGPGWAGTAAAGTVDDGFHSPKGCLFLTVYRD